jgi:DNA gyrase subunit A
MQFVKGPDFPDRSTDPRSPGHPRRLPDRARVDQAAGCRGDRRVRTATRIIVTDLPFQTSVEAIEQKIHELVSSRVIEGISGADNASAGGETRLVITLKRDANANVILNNLYKHTPMQVNFAVNTVALVDGVPRTSTSHSSSSLHRPPDRGRDEALAVPARTSAGPSSHRRGPAPRDRHARRSDRATIRNSDDRRQPRRPYGGAVLVLGDPGEPHPGHDARAAHAPRAHNLEEEIAELIDDRGARVDPRRPGQAARGHRERARSRSARSSPSPAGHGRRHDPGELGVEDLIEDEEIVVTMTRVGYIKAVSSDAFRTQGRGGRGVQGARLKEEDLVSIAVHTTTLAHLLLFSNKGRVFRLRAHEVPMKERTARGTPVVNLLPAGSRRDDPGAGRNEDFESGGYLMFATKLGQVKKTALAEYDKSRERASSPSALRDNDELVSAVFTSGDDDMLMVTRNGSGIRFSEEEVRPMGRDAAGVGACG